MNPQSSPRSVMDVSPRPLQRPAAAPGDQKSIAVQPAPANSDPQPAPFKPETTQPKPSTPSSPKTGAPVGVITIAVLVMMLLSVAAVIVYATSQTA